jgi:hypothetical protein
MWEKITMRFILKKCVSNGGVDHNLQCGKQFITTYSFNIIRKIHYTTTRDDLNYGFKFKHHY